MGFARIRVASVRILRIILNLGVDKAPRQEGSVRGIDMTRLQASRFRMN